MPLLPFRDPAFQVESIASNDKADITQYKGQITQKDHGASME
ncbi:MAG TPA: hypothetical protein VGS11_01735 [Candidatus Bathyarchaeia archaeon]|nr:hypothetical protein [Candidatus Bathyarchaeia archaeon]